VSEMIAARAVGSMAEKDEKTGDVKRQRNENAS
jgi:hypothetical protein